MKQIRILFVLLLMPTTAICELDSPLGTIHSGNFSNKRSPSSNFSFGQNIVSKKSLLAYTYITQLKGENTSYVIISPEILYGISNRLSLFVELPIVAKLDVGALHGIGIGDLIIQGEYAWHTKIGPHSIKQGTFVANITVPTAHISPDHQLEKTPPAGAGGVTFFCGATLSYLATQWYAFISDGATITLERNKNKLGNIFYYQWGFGHFLGTPWGITATGIFEFDGTFTQKDKTPSGSDENSGGNTLLLGPSLILASTAWNFQCGIQLPAIQHLNGTQNKQKFTTLFSLSYQFQ